MRFRQILGVVSQGPLQYLGWLLASLGGLVVAYAAALTVWIFHQDLGSTLPIPESWLISGTISLAVTGASYRVLNPDKSMVLSPILDRGWPFLLAIVYGVLAVMGVKTPVVDRGWVWLVAIAITTACYLWSSIIWLHDLAVRIEMEREPKPPEPSAVMQRVAVDLPKLPEEAVPPEEAEDASR